MSITIEEFSSSFHSLNGTTIGERRKNLFHLLNKTKQAGLTELDFSSLQPKTPLEETFKIETLIYFRRVPELLEILKSENPILIKRVLKVGSWFFLEACEGETGAQMLVTVIFPQVSFNVKLKILNKLSWYLNNPVLADQYFKIISDAYGLCLALKLLTACSLGVIMDCIKKKLVKPTPKQLLTIIKKYPKITKDILKLLKRNNIEVQSFYKKVFIYIARQDFFLFSKLLNKYNVSVHFGWRMTIKFIRSYTALIIRNSAEYYNILHKKQTMKSLERYLNDFYFNLFPQSLSKFQVSYEHILNLIKELPANKQNLNLLFANFKKVYGSELWDYPKYVNPTLLEMLPLNERLNRLKIDYKPSHFTQDEWNCYWEIEKSIPYLKKRISLTSDIKERAKLVRCLVVTCRINKDTTRLLGMCNYMLTQHRNDHIAVRLAFLNALQRDFKLENLQLEHWRYINEFIQIFTLNSETFYDEDDFLQSYIYCRLKNDLSVKDELIKWLESHNKRLNILHKTPPYQKKCLLMFGEIIPELYKGEKLIKYNISFLYALKKWNDKHPKDKISLFAYKSAMDTLRELLLKEKYVYEADCILVYCLQDISCDVEERKQLLDLYLKRNNKYADIEVMETLIQYEPLTVIDNIDVITRLVLKTERDNRMNCLFWKRCRNYTHLEIPQKIIGICLTAFDEEKEETTSNYQYNEIKMNIITAMSYLMVGDEFKKFITPYYPLEMKVNFNNENAERQYKMQKSIAHSLKNVIPSSQMLENVLCFCKGDFLKLVNGSLYSICGNTNENKLDSYIMELAKLAVSVRKHALHLTFRLKNKTKIYNIVELFMKIETNASLRKFMFKGTFNFFVKNCDIRSWELVKSIVDALDLNDKEAFNILVQVNKIPFKYVARYMIFTWSILNTLPDPDGGIKSKKGTLLDSLSSEVIQELSQNFCNLVIREHLFKDEVNQLAIYRFICKFIIYCRLEAEQETRLKSNFTILKKYITGTWNKAKSRNKGRNCLIKFTEIFCAEFLSNRSKDKEIYTKFFNLWDGFLEPFNSFNVYLHLHFTLIYVENMPLPEIVQRLAVLCDQLTEKYGTFIINLFYDKLKTFTKYFCTDDSEESMYDFIENFVQYGRIYVTCGVASSLLVILFLNNNIPVNIETKVRYEDIVETMRRRSDFIIQLYLENHFQNYYIVKC